MVGVLFDFVAYLMGYEKGKTDGTGSVVMETDAYTFTDANADGNVVIEEADNG